MVYTDVAVKFSHMDEILKEKISCKLLLFFCSLRHILLWIKVTKISKYHTTIN